MIKIPPPSRWGWKVYAFTAGFLVALNLLSPHGLLHVLLLKQERGRLELDIARLEKENAQFRGELTRFRQSRVSQERAVREELGYLKPHELSVELTREP